MFWWEEEKNIDLITKCKFYKEQGSALENQNETLPIIESYWKIMELD